MRRYFSSFFIAISFYAFFAVCLFYLMANDKVFIKKAEETKLISLNHIELKPEIKEEKKEPEPQTKEIVKEEKIVETPKPITPKKVEKKEIEKKITEKKVVEKQESEPTKKIQEQVNKIEEKAPLSENKLPPKPLLDEKKEYLDKHLAQIRSLINKNVKYPLKAKKLSIEGIVTVRFKINEDGTIENITIIDGHKFLQSATIEAIEEASKDFPKTNQSIEIQIPIEYKLI
ncbi:MAG: TonB family protein [Aliarcobacter sp.]|jgi:protein TonB|nr:TonB family protein [Aliarcobacter sp.]